MVLVLVLVVVVVVVEAVVVVVVVGWLPFSLTKKRISAIAVAAPPWTGLKENVYLKHHLPNLFPELGAFFFVSVKLRSLLMV